MIKRFFDYIADVIVGKGIKNVFAGSLIGYEVRASEYFQLMRYGGLRHRKQTRDIAHAHRFSVNRKQNTHSGAVAEYFEKIRKIVYLLAFGHPFPAFLKCLQMKLLFLAKR